MSQRIPPLLSGLLRYVAGPQLAHEEIAWRSLAHLIADRADDLSSDSAIRHELRRHARRVRRVRQAHPEPRGRFPGRGRPRSARPRTRP